MSRVYLTKEVFRSAIHRLKGKKEHLQARHSDEDGKLIWPTITPAIIANEIGCDKSTLYKTKDTYIQKVFAKFQPTKQKIDMIDEQVPTRNSKEYYKLLSDTRRLEIDELKTKIHKAKKLVYNYSVMLKELEKSKNNNERLIKEKLDLQGQNDYLRRQLFIKSLAKE